MVVYFVSIYGPIMPCIVRQKIDKNQLSNEAACLEWFGSLGPPLRSDADPPKGCGKREQQRPRGV